MTRTDVAIVVNCRAAEQPLLNAFFGMLRRQAAELLWPVFLATTEVDHRIVREVVNRYNVEVIGLLEIESGFLECREAAVRKLPPGIRQVLPLAPTFFLERPGPNWAVLGHLLEIFDVDKEVVSARLMPSPGPSTSEPQWGAWHRLLRPNDRLFSQQATIWRRTLLRDFQDHLITTIFEMRPNLEPGTAEWNAYCTHHNPAEGLMGSNVLAEVAPKTVHLCWPLSGSWANAVQDCPWPYRPPTTMSSSGLEAWAEELIEREGFLLKN